jgi:putative glutamine amidotransferase
VPRSPDGLIEGVELRSARFVVGIQGHPEELSRKEIRVAGLFRAFVEAARERRRAG